MESVKVNGYDFFYYDNGCNVEEYLKKGYLFGARAGKALVPHLTKDNTKESRIFDGGAHIGTFAFPFSVLGFDVIAVEPAAKNVECLRETFKNFNNFEVHQTILSDKKKRCDFSRDSGPFGWVLDNEEGMFTTSTVDEIVAGRHISLLKLDIEGSEFDALDGAKETIEKSRPLMSLEVNGFCLMQRGLNCNDLLKKVVSLGYTIFQPDLSILINPDRTFPFCTVDIIAIPKEVEYVINNEYVNVGDLADKEYLSEEDSKTILRQVIEKSNEDELSYFRKMNLV
jgi:FkbM family methyltransferase